MGLQSTSDNSSKHPCFPHILMRLIIFSYSHFCPNLIHIPQYIQIFQMVVYISEAATTF